jgi:hypothetical protein
MTSVDLTVCPSQYTIDAGHCCLESSTIQHSDPQEPVTAQVLGWDRVWVLALVWALDPVLAMDKVPRLAVRHIRGPYHATAVLAPIFESFAHATRVP